MSFLQRHSLHARRAHAAEALAKHVAPARLLLLARLFLILLRRALRRGRFLLTTSGIRSRMRNCYTTRLALPLAKVILMPFIPRRWDSMSLEKESEFPNEETESTNRKDSRRDFLRKAGLVAGGLGLMGLPSMSTWANEPTNCKPPASAVPAINFSPDTTLAVRTRKSAFDLTAAEKAKLQLAYKRMRDLTVSNPNDPRGWQQQANVHCWYCGGGSNGVQGEEIHGSYWFLPWHRCYLYFHERILGKLVGDPTLTLPYWDWENVSRRTMGPPYTTPNNATNSLFDAKRGKTPAQILPSSIVGAAAIANAVTNQPTFSSFGGTANNSGSLEQSPHGPVHVWTGTPFNSPNQGQDMGILATAAQDPIFFSHHGNIDRMWCVWLNQTPNHKNPTTAAWLSHSWTFYDENRRLVRIRVRDVLNSETQLRYRYANCTLPATMTAETDQKIETGGKGQTERVTVAAPVRQRVRSMRIGQSPDEKPERIYTLHIDAVDVPSNQSLTVFVFANLPEGETSPDIDSPNFVGQFTIVAKSLRAAGHNHRPQNIALNVTDKIATLLSSADNLNLTLIPYDIQSERPLDYRIKYGRVYLTEEQ